MKCSDPEFHPAHCKCFPAIDPNYVPPDDGLCHDYGEFEGLDCLQPKDHEGNHGDG